MILNNIVSTFKKFLIETNFSWDFDRSTLF